MIVHFSITDEEHPLNDIIFQTSGSRFSDLKKTLKFPEKDPSIETGKSNFLSQNGNMRQEGSSTLQKLVFICITVNQKRLRLPWASTDHLHSFLLASAILASCEEFIPLLV